jgi:hypothetical protein
MRLSAVCAAALCFTLALAVILLFSSNSLAQHSAGGGGSSGGASSSGGGSSHGGSSGGSSSSGSSGSHSSGGSASHSSSSHSLSSTSASSHSSVHETQSRSIHEPNAAARGETESSQKKSFLSFLRHPFRRHEPTPEPTVTPAADLRRPVCFKGPCPVCPAGQIQGGNGCGGTVITNNAINLHRPCRAGEHWGGGGCLQEPVLDECSGLRMMMERQAQRAQEAEATRQSACSADPQQCSVSTNASESEASFYRELQGRYQACQRKSPTAFPFSGFGVRGYSTGSHLIP